MQVNITVKTRYFIFLSYKGTSYHGWQIQPNSVTVQKMIEEALSVVLEELVSVIGAGRTDTGVHASFFCAHFDSSHSDLDTNQKFLFRLNSFLPKDIAVNSIKKSSSGCKCQIQCNFAHIQVLYLKSQRSILRFLQLVSTGRYQYSKNE